MKNKLFHDETGDVPGWVLITLMTAGLVVVMWSFAGPAGILKKEARPPFRKAALVI